jgi:asparagine synthase (glutamine-hydrolysing)
MCGIAGIYHRHGAPSGEWGSILRRMTRTLVHRGPDDEGYFADDFVALGHCRLSIVDLAGGQQPMANEDESVWLIFNGEIYNFAELRGLLEGKGHRFRSRSDTETIIHAYEEWDTDCLARLRGMFAFALWDARRRRLFLARDRLGKKPLYYAHVGNTLIFGSELTALTAFPGIDRSLDLEAVSDYLSLLYIPREKSIFRAVRKLLPGHYLTAGAEHWAVHRYWDIDFTPSSHDHASAPQHVAERLRDAVAVRLHSDVPLGAFLSGGIDSCTVVGLMAEAAPAAVRTAAIGFPDRGFDELPYARMAARHFGTDHREYVVTERAAAALDDVVGHYDEPFGDASAVPTFYAAKLARERVTVALSGDGGDETFAGYRRYAFDLRENWVRSWCPAPLRRPLFGLASRLYPKGDFLPQVLRGKAFLGNVARPPWEAYLHSVSGMAESDKGQVLHADLTRALCGYRTAQLFEELYRTAPAADALSRIQYVDFKTYLPDDILTKVDRASMANSLEVRCPLLDHPLVEYVASLPSDLKLRGARAKLVLKQAVRDLVPSAIIGRPKMGFAMPVAAWLTGPLRPVVETELLHAEHHLFEQAVIRHMWRQQLSGVRDRSTELWGLLMFNLWHKRLRREPTGVGA